MILLLWAAVVAGSATLAATQLGINTSQTDMISPEVPFRQNHIAFQEAFPQFSGVLVVVIDGPTPEGAETATANLAEALEAHPDVD